MSFTSFPSSGHSSRSRAVPLPESSYLLGEGDLTNFGKKNNERWKNNESDLVREHGRHLLSNLLVRARRPAALQGGNARRVGGHGTWESIGRKPLKGRRNLVVTSSAHEYSERGIPDTDFIPSLSDAPSDAWVIGGAALIDEAFDVGLIDEFYVTTVGVWGRDSDVPNRPKSEAIDEFYSESSLEGYSVTGIRYYIDHYVR